VNSVPISRQEADVGAFGEFFGFNGRVNRLGYLWRSIVVVIALALVGALGAAGLVMAFHPESVTGAVDLARQVITATFLLALWSSFALATRRLRDMGFEPAHIVPVYAAFWVVNAVLLEPLSRTDPAHFAALEFGWGALQWLVAAPLLFWPSRDGRPAPKLRYDEPAQPTAYLNWRESG
jgi:uncharacterized membrane protein YhaH (DUF805 family)